MLPLTDCHSLHSFYAGGKLKCSSGCYYDTSDCELPVCGNGRMEVRESCDGADIPYAECSQLLSGTTGRVKCSEHCSLDPSECVSSTCGNGKVDHLVEQCDGRDGVRKCQDFDPRYIAGEMRCDSKCHLDASPCVLR